MVQMRFQLHKTCRLVKQVDSGVGAGRGGGGGEGEGGSVDTSAAGRPVDLTVAHTYSVPFSSASGDTSAGVNPHFRQKPSSALLGDPSGPNATCHEDRARESEQEDQGRSSQRCEQDSVIACRSVTCSSCNDCC